MEIYHDGVPVYELPEYAVCKADEKKETRSIWMFALWDTTRALMGANMTKNGKKARIIS